MATGYGVSSTSLNGCVLYFDAANPKSYPGAGTTLFDLSGNGNNGTLTNGPVFNNLFGGCIQTDGSNDYISVSHNSTLNFGTGDFTILMWVSGITGYPGCVRTLLWKGGNFANNNAGYTMAWACNSPALYFITADGSTKINFTDSPIYSLNGWTGVKLVGMRRSGGNLYQINNGITTLLGASALNVNNSSTMYIAYDATYNGYLSCRLHAMQLFSRGLTDNELSNTFSASRNRYFGNIPFSPSDISGLRLWLDADDSRTLFTDTSGTTRATTDGTAVALWVDKSGNGNNVSQSTPSARPAIKSSFTNGRNVLNFDGSNDTLIAPSSTATFKFLHSTGSTVFIVVQYKATGTYRSYFTTATSSVNVGYIIFTNTDNTTYLPWIAGGVSGNTVCENRSSADYIDATQPYLVCAVGDPTNATAANRGIGYKDGGAPYKSNIKTTAASTANSTYDLAIGSEGGVYYANVYIAEILAYNTILTASQRIQVETYLNNKWGLWSSFNPTSISGLQLWLDSSDSGTLFQDSAGVIPAINDGDPVGYWKDKSGNGRNATQTASTQRPLLKTSIQNSKNILRFDGSNDYFGLPAGNYGDSLTCFIVYKWTAASTPGNAGYLYAFGGSVSPKQKLNVMYMNGAQPTYYFGERTNTAYIANTTKDAYFINSTTFTSPYGAANLATFDNGISLSISSFGSIGSSGATNDNVIGADKIASGIQTFTGDMAEIIIYNSVLSTAQRQQVEQYLNQKWGVF